MGAMVKADNGELSSLDVWRILGFQGDLEAIEREYLDTLEVNPEFYDFADKMRKKFKLAIISNDSSRWSHYVREKFDLNKYFDVISISGDLKLSKPDERIFKITLDKLGCTVADCFYVDDREGNLKSAQKIGMDAVMMNSRNSEYAGNKVAGFQELAEILIR